MKTILLTLLVTFTLPALADNCYSTWMRQSINTEKWLNQKALEDKLKSTKDCEGDIKRLKAFSGPLKIQINIPNLARCMAARIKKDGHYDIGLTKTKGDFLPTGCSIPTKVYENADVAAKFLECRDGDYKTSTNYMPNRVLKCGANYCFLMKVDQMLDNDLNNCPNCVELRKFIEDAPILSLNIGNIFAKALELTGNNISESLLISYYALGHDWKRPEPLRNLDYFHASLMSISPKRYKSQDNFGPWYHFFGTAFFALSHESVSYSMVGSLVAELIGDVYNLRMIDPNEIKRDLQGAQFLGELLKSLKQPFTPADNDCTDYYKAIPLS